MTMTQQEVACPKCGGRMWDNRETKKNPKQPDFKCRDKGCEGVIWPPRNGAAPVARPAAPAPQAPASFGGPLPWEQQETGAPPSPYAAPAAPNGDRLAAQFAVYSRCLDQARVEVLRSGLDKMGGDVAGAVAAMAATLYIQASK